MSATEDRLRSLAFSSSAEPRFWWHRLAGSNYVPPIYSDLTEEQWGTFRGRAPTWARRLAGGAYRRWDCRGYLRLARQGDFSKAHHQTSVLTNASHGLA